MITIGKDKIIYNANPINTKILASNTHDVAITCPFKADNQAYDHVSLSLTVMFTCRQKRDRRKLELLCKKHIPEIKAIFTQDFYTCYGYGYEIDKLLKSKTDSLDFNRISLSVYYNA